MSERRLLFVINAGEKTCYATPGKPCQYVRIGRTEFTCHLFDKELKDENNIRSGPGWLQRLPECLLAEKRGTSDVPR